jgi:glucosamine--fructose-6-phosphate aminotransferase (isomerizing)
LLRRGVYSSEPVYGAPSASAEISAGLGHTLLQLFAYHVAQARGLNVDQPRNLAKTVTVD